MTVHNPMETEHATHPGFYTLLYDWPFPWTDCMLRQAQVAALSTAPEISDDIPESKTCYYNFRGYARHNQLMIDLRRFGIPVINEEPGYEMEGRQAIPSRLDVQLRPWNSQTEHSLVPTFWSAAMAGGYVMWGNYATYWLGDPLRGIKRSMTPKRLKVLHDFMTSIPYWEMVPSNESVHPAEKEMSKEPFRTNYCLAKAGEVYVIFSIHCGEISVTLDDGTYQVTQVDPRSGGETDRGQVAGGTQMISVDAEEEQVLLFKCVG